MRLLASLLVCLGLLLSGVVDATIRTPGSTAQYFMTGFCADIRAKSPTSLHFCASQVEVEGKIILVHILYVELRRDKFVPLNDNEIDIVHEKLGNHIPLQVDGKILSIRKNEKTNRHLSLYFIVMPDIMVKLIKDGQPTLVRFSSEGRTHKFKLTEEEQAEFRMIAGLEILLPREKMKMPTSRELLHDIIDDHKEKEGQLLEGLQEIIFKKITCAKTLSCATCDRIAEEVVVLADEV